MIDRVIRWCVPDAALRWWLPGPLVRVGRLPEGFAVYIVPIDGLQWVDNGCCMFRPAIGWREHIDVYPLPIPEALLG